MANFLLMIAIFKNGGYGCRMNSNGKHLSSVSLVTYIFTHSKRTVLFCDTVITNVAMLAIFKDGRLTKKHSTTESIHSDLEVRIDSPGVFRHRAFIDQWVTNMCPREQPLFTRYTWLCFYVVLFVFRLYTWRKQVSVAIWLNVDAVVSNTVFI